MPKAVIWWDKKESIDYHQRSYSDESTYRVPYTGELTTKEALEAMYKNYPAQSSQGALRWRSGWRIVEQDESNKTLIITEITSICD